MVDEFLEIPKSVSQGGGGRSLPQVSHRTADITSLGAGADVHTIPAQEHMPFFSEFDLSIPRDLTLLNRLVDYYQTFHPIVANSLDLHTEIAWSDFSIQCGDGSIQRDYEDMIEELNLKFVLYGMYHEYFAYGESILLGDWDEGDRIWKAFNGIPMSKLKVDKIPDPVTGVPQFLYYYQVDPADRRRIESYHSSYSGPYDVDYITYDVSENFAEAYLNYGDLIPIHEFYIFRIYKMNNTTDLRGRSNILRCLKYLIWEDYLIRAQLKIARDRINAPDVWLIGSTEKPPTSLELQTWRELLEKQANDPNYQIVAAPPLDLKTYANTIRLLQTEPYFRIIDEKIAEALWTDPSSLTNPRLTYAGEAVVQGVRESRYNTIRKLMERELIQKVFMPVAIARGYTKRKTADIQHKVRTSTKGEDVPKFVYHRYGERPNRGPILSAQKWPEDVNIVQRMASLGSSVAKHGAGLSKRDLELPSLIPVDRIRLQDVTEKVRALATFARDYPIPFPYICNLLGIDWDQIKEDLKDVEDNEAEAWLPPVLRPGYKTPMGGGLEVPAMGGGGIGTGPPGPIGGLAPGKGTPEVPSPIPQKPIGTEVPAVTPPLPPVEGG